MTDHLERERRVCRFLDSIKDDAAQLFLLGDILDYWYEYKYVVPRGYIRFLGKLAELADSGVSITWVTGNHDVWLFDYLRDQIGLTVLNGHTVVEAQGKRILISHGDDVGVQPVMYRFTRWCFYNKVCQWLYAAIHPRWTYPIATGWSNENRTRRNPEQQRDISERAGNQLPWAMFYESYNRAEILSQGDTLSLPELRGNLSLVSSVEGMNDVLSHKYHSEVSLDTLSQFVDSLLSVVNLDSAVAMTS